MMDIVCAIGQLFLLVLLIRMLMSWVPPVPGTTYARVFEFFDAITEPVLGPVRRMLPPVAIGVTRLDLSPLVVFFGVIVLLRVLGCGAGLF